jgi:phage gp36-like protein
MAYIDREGLEARFGTAELAQLADRDSDGTEAAGELETIERACSDASTLIDGYLASKYTLPLSSVPDLVAGWAADIARYRLWDSGAPEEIRRRYDDAIGQLRDLAKGTIALPPGADGSSAESAEAVAVFGGFSACRKFTDDTLRGY